jgi:hypothetical protein
VREGRLELPRPLGYRILGLLAPKDEAVEERSLAGAVSWALGFSWLVRAVAGIIGPRRDRARSPSAHVTDGSMQPKKGL